MDSLHNYPTYEVQLGKYTYGFCSSRVIFAVAFWSLSCTHNIIRSLQYINVHITSQWAFST